MCEEVVNYFMVMRDIIQYFFCQYFFIMFGFFFFVYKLVVKGKGMDYINFKLNQGKSFGVYYNC